MRASRLVLTFLLSTLAPRLVHAECVGSDDREKVLGVASDGRLLYSHETRSDAADRGEGTYELAIVAASGEAETTVTRAANGAWQLDGKPLPPSVLAGKPSPRVLEARVQALLGALTPLVSTKRDVRVVKGETVYRVFLDRALIKMMRAPSSREDITTDRSWIARTYRHPASSLVFVSLSSHTQPQKTCTIHVETLDWYTPQELDPNDKSVASAFCDEQLERDESRSPPSDDDDDYRVDDPLSRWVACTKDVFAATYLEKSAARAATLEGTARARLLRAVAHVIETSWAPLVRMAQRKQSDERAFALATLAMLDAELRNNRMHGDKRDPAFRSALLPELKRLCVASPNASPSEAAALAECVSAIGQPTTDIVPEEEPCHPGSCMRQLVGVAPDGRFVIEQQRTKLAYELRAPDGQLILRITDNCKGKVCSMRWDLEGAASPAILELASADPKPERLRAGLVKLLALTPAAPSSQRIALDAQVLRIGLWAIATLEQDKLGTMAPLEHGKSRLVFVDTADETCADARCHLVVWGPRPVADASDFAALSGQCQKLTEVAPLADCFGAILDERVYPFLMQYARGDDDWRFHRAAARVATALGRKPLFDYAGMSDAFKRQWALNVLKQLLEDTTERLPFSGRTPDKRRPALVAEIEPYCKRGLADRDLVVAASAIACLAQTGAKIDPARVREVLHSPHLDARAAVFEVAKRENLVVGAELRYVAGWLTDPIDKKDPDYQEWLHGEICTLFVTKLDAANKAWLRPLVESRVKTMTLRPDSKGACKALLQLL